MSIEEKIENIRLLLDLNGKMIVDKLENIDGNKNTLDMAKDVAKKLAEAGVGAFDFSSDEKFIESLNNFLIDF